MHIQILLEPLIREGNLLMQQLHGRLEIVAAFWIRNEDPDEWRLMIVSPAVSKGESRVAYSIIERAIRDANLTIPLQNIFLVSPTNLRYKQVRLASQGISSGVNIAHNFAGLGLAGDAFVYVMS